MSVSQFSDFGKLRIFSNENFVNRKLPFVNKRKSSFDNLNTDKSSFGNKRNWFGKKGNITLNITDFLVKSINSEVWENCRLRFVFYLVS